MPVFTEIFKILFVSTCIKYGHQLFMASVSWFKKLKKNTFFSSIEITFYRFGWKVTIKENNLILLNGKLIKRKSPFSRSQRRHFYIGKCETHCWKIWVTIKLILAVGFGSSKRSAGKFLHNSPFWLHKLANHMVFLAMRALTSN